MDAKVCDRYGTVRDVETYTISVEFTSSGVTVIDRTFDLSPRGLAWVKGLIEKGIAKLDARGAKDGN